MTHLVKDLIVGSPLERMARAVYGWVSTAGKYDQQTLEVMDRVLHVCANSVCIGGDRGDMLREIIRRTPRGRHFGIEPVPERFADLKARYPQATLFNVAASDKAHEAAFHEVRSSPPLSGISQRDRTGRGTIRVVHVLTARIDDLVPTDLPVRLMKLGIQAGELAVFRGAKKLIQRCHPYIIFDCLADEGIEDEGGPEEIYDLLIQCGLAVSLMEDWLKGHSPLSRGAFCDQVMDQRNFCFLAHP